MTTKYLLSFATAAIMAGTTSAVAVPQSIIEDIVADLTSQGFHRIEIEVDDYEIEVDAYGRGFEADLTYTHSGRLIDIDWDDDRGHSTWRYIDGQLADDWDDDEWEDDDDDEED